MGWGAKAKTLLVAAFGKDSEHFKAIEKAEKVIMGVTNYTVMKRQKALFLAAKEDFEAGHLTETAPDMDAWISAAHALELLGMGHAGKKVICKRAHADMIKARAELILRDGVAFNTVEVHPEFWWAKGEEALTQNWTTGDFDTWLGRKTHMEVFGVTFRRNEIEKMKPKLLSSSATNSKSAQSTSGKNIVIGHGHSHQWMLLKDFLIDRLNLPFDEFNRISTAGVATANRLEQMLDNAAFAFLVLTAEDEQADGKFQSRPNVIHEAGLFQGRLGFQRAIVMLEEGCEEFSNIHGLGQLRFPKGNIKAEFEEVRRVLEREKIINPS